eukprot:360503-Chlamydomonas_euryale.AAC.4
MLRRIGHRQRMRYAVALGGITMVGMAQCGAVRRSTTLYRRQVAVVTQLWYDDDFVPPRLLS